MRRLAAFVLAVLVGGCAVPLDDPASLPAAAPGDGPVETDAAARTIQLYQTGDEATLPVLTLGRGDETLTLEFDLIRETSPRSLRVRFEYVGRGDGPTLTEAEAMTGFGEDDILDTRVSGGTDVRYVHYAYQFPNTGIGFRVSGAYQLTVVDGATGEALFERPFFVDEAATEIDLFAGTTLAGGVAGTSVQPAARLRPRGELADADPFLFTVCFARNGRLDALRCAPDATLAERAVYGFFLPRDEAFEPPEPLFRFDHSRLLVGEQIVDIDFASQPPGAVLEVDIADFGGDLLTPSLETVIVVGSPGRPDVDAEYVATTFRYVPTGSGPLTTSVRLVGGFASGRPGEETELAWDPAAEAYTGTVLLKQGRYVYRYEVPGVESRRGRALAQPTVYTAFVFYRDLSLFADRLVGVQSLVVR